MRKLLLLLVLLCSPALLHAGRNKLTPSDFEPLTTLPWLKHASVEEMLDAIYREPGINIRYPVLAAYLETVFAKDFGEVFDRCLTLEGTQVPGEFLEFFLEIWAKRDPEACWARTKQLFRVVGVEDGWLSLDGWIDRPLVVRDAAAFRASPVWIRTASVFSSFPLGVSDSSRPAAQRAKILKEFLDLWITMFGDSYYGPWPGYPRLGPQSRQQYSGYSPEVLQAFGNLETFSEETVLPAATPSERAATEIKLRRWVLADPHKADIVKKIRESSWRPSPGRAELPGATPSNELLMVWAKADLPGLIRWTESLDLRADPLAPFARGFLMSRVDAAKREGWLADAHTIDKEKEGEPQKPGGYRESVAAELFDDWAAWDPKAALAHAAAAKDGNLISAAVDSAISWPAWNMRRCGFDAINDFDVFDVQLPKADRDDLLSGWPLMVLEVWGEIDVGETARYGLDFVLRSGYAPREGLIKFFSGENIYAGEDGAIDRTFCALRVWAAFKPGEMKAWIATLQDAEMRKALTWLLEHPWGGTPGTKRK